jgi:hypothetical protein
LVFALRFGVEDVFDAFKNADDQGTMSRKNGDKTWKQTCIEERSHIRLPVSSLPISSIGKPIVKAIAPGDGK